MTKPYTQSYLAMLALGLLLSAYPLYHGARIVLLVLQNGALLPEQYAQYVIPYTALSLSVLCVTALQPLVFRAFGKRSLAASTLFTFALFVLAEWGMESIKIDTGGFVLTTSFAHPNNPTADLLQLALCVFTPDASNAALRRQQAFIGPDGFYRAGGDWSYRIHHLLIAAVLILLFTGLFHAFGQYARTKERGALRKAAMRGVCAIVFLGLCVFANRTGFFRDRSTVQSIGTGLLTGLYFIAFGMVVGVYVASLRDGKSGWLPVVSALIAVCAMYVGEGFLLDGTLYRYGTGWFFAPAVGIAAPVDWLIVLCTGGFTAALLRLLRKRAPAAAVTWAEWAE